MNSFEFENIHLSEEEGSWTLVLETRLEHPCSEVWSALTEKARIPKWGPFNPDRDLTEKGPVNLTMLGTPEVMETQGDVLEARAPQLLVLKWGDDRLSWELSSEGDQTQLVLRHHFNDRKQAPSYAAGWHLCLKGFSGQLAGKDTPSMAGQNAYQYGWQDLYEHYAKLLSIDLLND
ncbi:SRPBCC family protein [Pullulanibacillus sp. KACC 23026]|uniref:SRPBCC family protein n=1 Tax=Pullulanibacillus sp. KACC 23026 TaxID=3028315 RepID=UPI0023B03FD3|nr:SRPBCC family protein [Pullulanibacillus sp. KACC 23026]WEG13196.1 SRPBCC family protein [Pullulanibacillus sp. KACC 23026]